MTTTPTASTALPDLDKLKALAHAATPGEWKAMPYGRVVGGPLRHYVNGSAPAQIASFGVTFHEQAPEDEPERQQANADFAAAANPEQVLALIALARRAQPEGEAPRAKPICKVCGADVALNGETCGVCFWKPAATLSPLCGAQHAAAPGALLAILRDVHDTLSSESDSDLDHFEDDEEEREGAPVQYAARKVMEVMDMLNAAAPSAPGTPEATQTDAARDVLAERQRQVEAEGWTPDRDDNYTDGELARAAAAYSLASTADAEGRAAMESLGSIAAPAEVVEAWPALWGSEWLKPKNRRADLVRAGALLLAEVERLDRAAAPKGGA